MYSYALVTPARNEAEYLPKVIESVLLQTVKPAKWIIVSDGSTDGTDDIAEAAAKSHAYIFFVSTKGGAKRSFGSKTKAFQAGYDVLGDEEYDYIGNLDADITFEPGYYARMLAEMENNPRLGIASGVCWEKIYGRFQMITKSFNHAVGGVQFFRRNCFEDIGGYQPVSVGGIDSLAERTARMKGWETTAFPDLPLYHHKPVDSVNGRGAVRICYRAGLTEYHIGTHPLFAIAKALRRWREAPVFLSMFIRLYGYSKLWVSGTKRDASDELVAYLKTEQMAALKNVFLGKWQP